MELERCLKRGRRARKLTQRDVAEMAGMAIQDFIKLESGIFADVEEDSLRRLACAIGADERIIGTGAYNDKNLAAQEPTDSRFFIYRHTLTRYNCIQIN